MTQNDMPAPAVVDEELDVIEVEAVEVEMPLVEYVPPASPRPEPKPAKPAPAKPLQPAPRNSAAPDPFAVGVRVMKLAPAWLLFTAVCCFALVLLLSWVRTGGEAEAVTLPAKTNDARAAKRVPAPPETGAKVATTSATNPSVESTSSPKSTAANDAPPAALAQATTPAAQTPQPAPAAAPKADEKARVETSSGDVGGNFTAQVGSFNSQSEANERVSSLRAAGFEARAVAAELPGRGTWYRVQVGRFADKIEAAKAVAALRAKGAATTALVVPVQK